MPASLLTVAPLTASGIPHVFYDFPSQGLIGWYDATQIVGVTSGTSLSAWTDLSGNGNHLVQSLITMQPVFVTNVLNGKSAVSFSGVTRQLIGTFALPQTSTVFVVYSNRTGTNGTFFSASSGNNATTPLQRSGDIWADAAVASISLVDANTKNLLVFAADYSADSWTARYNSASTTTGEAITLSVGSFELGTWRSLTEPLTAYIEEVGVYNRVLTLAQIQQLESYATTKYGI